MKPPPAATRFPAAIALGANLGDPEAALLEACRRLDHVPGLDLLSVSSLYASEPWGDSNQPEFRNAVAVGTWTGDPDTLLRHLMQIEAAMGKRPIRRWGPRAIDLDLLLLGDCRCAGPELELPHPRMADRPFVYLPLAEAASGAGFSLALPAPSQAGRAIEPGTRRLNGRGWFPAHSAGAAACDLVLRDVEETRLFAGHVAGWLQPGDVIGLVGPLGAGKSELARSVLRHLGVTGPIPSPTFTLCREYETPRGTVRHWDFYRLTDDDDLASTGFDADDGAMHLIEWADRFQSQLPARTVLLTLAHDAGVEDRRTARLERTAGLPFLLRHAAGLFPTETSA